MKRSVKRRDRLKRLKGVNKEKELRVWINFQRFISPPSRLGCWGSDNILVSFMQDDVLVSLFRACLSSKKEQELHHDGVVECQTEERFSLRLLNNDTAIKKI